MLKWSVSRIGRIVGGIAMKATYWTEIGVMLIPIGIVVAIQWPTWNFIAVCLVISGLVSVIAGWTFTIKEERQKQAEAKKTERLRLKEDKQRRIENRINLLVLSEIAKSLGVKTGIMAIKLRKLTEEENVDEEEIEDG